MLISLKLYILNSYRKINISVQNIRYFIIALGNNWVEFGYMAKVLLC